MLPGLMIGAAAAPVVGGVLGSIFGGGDSDKANQMAQEAYQILGGVPNPQDTSTPLLLQKYVQAGVLTPQQAQAAMSQASQVAQIKEDPALKNAQTQALQLLGSRATGGLNATDRANLNKVRSEVQRDQEAKMQQIMQNMAARGQGGSGSELAAQLSAAQGGAQTQAQASDNIMAQAQQAALQAAGQYGGLAGQIRNQDFGVNEARARAADEMNRFNVGNQQQANMYNAQAGNQAQQFNLSNAQNVGNMNTQTANQEQQRQAAAKQQYWQDQLALANSKASAAMGQSQYYQNQANQTRNQWAGMGNAVGSGIGSIAMANALENRYQKPATTYPDTEPSFNPNKNFDPYNKE